MKSQSSFKNTEKYLKIFQARGDYVEEEKLIFESVRLLKIWLQLPKSLYYKERFLREGASLERAIIILSRGLTGDVVNAGDLLNAIKNMEYVSGCYIQKNWKSNFLQKLNNTFFMP